MIIRRKKLRPLIEPGSLIKTYVNMGMDWYFLIDTFIHISSMTSEIAQPLYGRGSQEKILPP